MKVRDLIELFTEDCQTVELFDTDLNEVVFEGTADEVALTKYEDYEVGSIDTLFKPATVLTINIAES